MLNSSDRALLLERLRRVRPESKPVWGTLDAPKMVCHVSDMIRVALGDIPSKPTHTFFSRTLGKAIVVNTSMKPPRGKIQTAPEMLSSRPTSWEGDVAACEALVARIAQGTASAVHPAFGPLSSEEWGRLCWKHLNHHLEQFGV